MQLTPENNSTTIRLEEDELFYFKSTLLKGFAPYDWTIPPPHPWGSPLVRFYYRTWVMKEVVGGVGGKEFRVYGSHPRGNFRLLTLKQGERHCVNIRFLAGFSGDLGSLHTRIRFAPAYWLLHRHFFPVFEGPGTLLLYGGSTFEESVSTEFQPHRLVAFEASKRFRPISPQPRRFLSQIINLLFSHEVIWQFEKPGQVLAETHAELEMDEKDGLIKRFLRHILSFFKF